jgi:heme-degrading monooxygenase HmoA
VGRRRLTVYRIVWMYDVKPETAVIFERVYGAEGDWVRLFRTARGYLGTELFRSVATPGRYVTVDDWESLAAYDIFRARAGAAYAELDARCDDLTQTERLVSAGETNGG